MLFPNVNVASIIHTANNPNARSISSVSACIPPNSTAVGFNGRVNELRLGVYRYAMANINEIIVEHDMMANAT
jgi:hypothetical protein